MAVIKAIYKQILRGKKRVQKENTLRQIVDLQLFCPSRKIIMILTKLIENSLKDEMYRFQILQTVMQNIRPKHLDIFDEFALDNKADAFSEVIKTMKQMEKIAVPNKKFELLTVMKDQIFKEIKDFWIETNSKKAKQDAMKIIDVDNLVMIFEYCVIKTVDKRLLIQRRLIDEFTNKNFLIFGEGSFLYNNF